MAINPVAIFGITVLIMNIIYTYISETTRFTVFKAPTLRVAPGYWVQSFL